MSLRIPSPVFISLLCREAVMIDFFFELRYKSHVRVERQNMQILSAYLHD